MMSPRIGHTRAAAVLVVLVSLTVAAVADAMPRNGGPPQVSITAAPKAKIKVKGNRTATATWEFTADDPVNFTCKLTGMGFVRPCLSPITYAGLTKGKFTFTVYATRPIYNGDSSRARDVIKVKKKKKNRHR